MNTSNAGALSGPVSPAVGAPRLRACEQKKAVRENNKQTSNSGTPVFCLLCFPFRFFFMCIYFF